MIPTLRAIAEKATAGPWEFFEELPERLESGSIGTVYDRYERFPVYDWLHHAMRNNRKFIATFDPIMVGKLLDVVEAAEADRAHAAECFGCETCESLQDDLRAALARLEDDE